uniref:BTB domain-containing protein n=1 Tax=Erpetoichthys calabaricus TaxID=27687 RepID=A0A8C4TFA2_ERPCA
AILTPPLAHGSSDFPSRCSSAALSLRMEPELELEAESHARTLLDSASALRGQQLLCDVTLDAQGQAFPAHKLILASASGYCRVLFLGTSGTPDDGVVKLKDVSARGLGLLLDFIYTGKVRLSLATVEDTLRAAQTLLVRDAIKLCLQFLDETLGPENCLEVLRIAQKLGPGELRQKAASCLARSALSLPRDPEWLLRLDGDTLCETLRAGNLPAHTELELFQYAVAWLSREVGRKKDACHVLGHIRFPLIPMEELRAHVQEAPVVKTDSECFRLVQEALSYHCQPYAQPALQSPRTQVRADVQHLLVLGGRTGDDDGVCGHMWVAESGGSEWRKLGELGRPVYNHCVAVLGGFVFIIGGQYTFDAAGRQPTNEVFRFDPRNGSWLQVSGMLHKRTRFHAEALADSIFSVAGGTLLGTLTNTVEEYQPMENKWNLCAPFPVAVADHAGASHKGILYISGKVQMGTAARGTQSTVGGTPPTQLFSFPQRSLTRLFCALQLQEWVHVNETECYCPLADQWTTLTVSPFECCQFSVGTCGTRLFLVGGASLRHRLKKNDVFIYDSLEKKWQKAASLPLPLIDHAACVVKLDSRLLRDSMLGEKGVSVVSTKKSTLQLFVRAKGVESDIR